MIMIMIMLISRFDIISERDSIAALKRDNHYSYHWKFQNTHTNRL